MTSSAANDGCGLVFKAVDTHVPGHSGELTLFVGDVVTDVKNLGNGWVLGRNVTCDCVGIAPAACLRPLAELTLTDSHPHPYHQQPASDSVSSSSVSSNQYRTSDNTSTNKQVENCYCIHCTSFKHNLYLTQISKATAKL